MEYNDALIQSQKELIKKLSEINLNEDKKTAYETGYKYLEITDQNKGGIVSLWLEKKKEKFKEYLLNKIIIDINLPIYYKNLTNGKRNYSQETLNSIDSAYSKIKEQWINESMEDFLNTIFDEKSAIRYKDGEKAFLKFYNKIYEKSLITAFIENFNKLINNILAAKINDSKTRNISFGFIRRMTDCIYYNEFSGLTTNPYFKKRMSNVFSNSRRLIRNLFAFEFIKNLEIFQIINIPSGEYKKENNIIEYKYDDDNIIIRFKPKEIGINSGFILNIIKIEKFNQTENILKSFYVKKYYGSTKSGSKNFEEKESGTFFSSSAISFNASSSSIGKKSEWKRRKLDLKEPFLYALLNILNYVPEVKFFINPYTIDGFYIATKNLSDNKNTFLSLSKLSIKSIKDNFNLINESLNQIDFISRIFRLRDLHNNNFGFIVENNQQIYKSLAVIDFAQPIFMESYRISSENIIKDFLQCTYSEQKNEGIKILHLDDSDLDELEKLIKNSLLKVEERKRIINGFNTLKQIKERIEAVKLEQMNLSKIQKKVFKDEESDDSLDEKLRNILFITSENIKNLMLQKRGVENKPEEYMLKDPITKEPRTNAELIGFKLIKDPKKFDTSKGQLDYLDDAFEDLDNYIQCIMYNYKIIKKFILESYNKYFNN